MQKKRTEKRTTSSGKTAGSRKSKGGKKTTAGKGAKGKRMSQNAKKKSTRKTSGSTTRKKTASSKTSGKTTKKTAARKAAPSAGRKRAAAKKPTAAPKSSAGKPRKRKKLSAKTLADFRQLLLSLRSQLSEQVDALTNESLTRQDSVNSPEDGTDAFDRQFSLTVASSEQDSIFEIDAALRRIDEGTYGLCEDCGDVINVPRLKALPFVRSCIGCQSVREKNRVKFRPAAALGA